jgi:hypothetical protein
MEIAEIVNAATVDASEKIKIIFEGLFKKWQAFQYSQFSNFSSYK